MRLERQKLILVIVVLVVLLVVFVAVISRVWPTQERSFFELSLLDENKMAEGYFANVNSTVEIGITSRWFIYVHNHMEAAQNISIKAKFGSLLQVPDDSKNQFSNATVFAEFPLSITNNQTVFIPFYWNITKVEANADSTLVNLFVNEKPIEIHVSKPTDLNFRMIFELWVQNPDSGEYSFNWVSTDGLCSASVYIGFRINPD